MNERLHKFLQDLDKKGKQDPKSDTTVVYMGGTIPKTVEGDPKEQVQVDECDRELFQ